MSVSLLDYCENTVSQLQKPKNITVKKPWQHSLYLTLPHPLPACSPPLTHPHPSIVVMLWAKEGGKAMVWQKHEKRHDDWALLISV